MASEPEIDHDIIGSTKRDRATSEVRSGSEQKKRVAFVRGIGLDLSKAKRSEDYQEWPPECESSEDETDGSGNPMRISYQEYRMIKTNSKRESSETSPQKLELEEEVTENNTTVCKDASHDVEDNQSEPEFGNTQNRFRVREVSVELVCEAFERAREKDKGAKYPSNPQSAVPDATSAKDAHELASPSWDSITPPLLSHKPDLGSCA